MRTGFQFIPESRPLQYLPASRVFWVTPSAPNTSLYNYPLELWSTIPESELIVKLCVFVPVIVFGLLGNGILLEVIFSNRTLRTPSHLLIANLVITDFLTLLVCPVFFLTHDFFQNYLLGPIGCKLEGLIEGGLLVTSVLGMCVISYDRLSAVVLSAGTRLKGRGTVAAIGFCWIVGFVMAMPLLLYRHFKVRHWMNLVEMYCYEDRSVLATYWEFLLVMLVWFPLGVMLIAYTLIIVKLDRYERNALRRQHPMVVRYKSRVAKTLYIVLLAFIVVRVPFTIMVFVYYSIESIEYYQFSESFIFIWWLAKVAFIFLNAAINPLIYGLTNKTFKKALRGSKILQCLCRLPPEEESTGTASTIKRQHCCCLGPINSDDVETSQDDGILDRSRFSRVSRRFRATWLNSTLRGKQPKHDTTVEDKS
ncbi:neuropeptide Y receptor type 2-like [Anopheles ziemanni]|uniref:neuropeptide Y receptor type 2-like n=1 Tax=Anopheles coustani TaxID=139045 RepID=UPI00265A1CF3|nr:neuropeptide Y receptor type 2-like [Anopheles coustani]XP_058174481.1 neuropeptide Y receptor type 2-like [Anopheles ziemanni]